MLFSSLPYLQRLSPHRLLKTWMPILYDNCYFDFIVKFSVIIGPCSAVCAYHIATMAESAEVKSISFAYDNIFMAHSHCDPIRIAFLNFEMESFIITSFF